MPIVTRTTSAQNVSKKNLKTKWPLSSSIKTNMGSNKNKSVEQCKENSRNNAREPSTPKNNKRPLSPVLVTTPPPKKLMNNNDSLIAQLEEGEQQDLALQDRLRQSFEESGKLIYS